MSDGFWIDSNSWMSIVSKAWTDENFKEKLVSSPSSALAEFGIEVPKGIELNIQENSSSTVNFVLPEPPANEKLDLDDAPNIFAGTGQGLPTLCCGTSPPSV